MAGSNDKVRPSATFALRWCGWRFAVVICAVWFVAGAHKTQAAGVVGTGSAASCTDAALNTMLTGGGLVTFNCGGGLVTIDISPGAGGTGTKTIAADTTIDGGSLITISGGNSVGVFSVNPGVNFTVQNLTIANGNSGNSFGGGIANGIPAYTEGGPIVGGTVMITNSTFSGNSAPAGGGIANGGGTLMVTNSTFADNSTSFTPGIGGGIFNYDGTLTVTNSTFSGNSAGSVGVGGGIYNFNDDGTLTTVTNSTFSDNSALYGGSIFNDRFSGTVTLANTIVANSTSGGNCVGSVTDGGHNLDDGVSCGFSAANDSLSSTNPQLDPAGLANNGGPTQTIALQAGSPAVNAGDESVCAAPSVNGLDQRGYARPGSGRTQCSIGAYEADAAPAGPARGDLTFIAAEREGVSDWNGPDWVTVSPDGAHVYAAGYVRSALAVFSRNLDTGRLTFVEARRDGFDGVSGLAGAIWVAVSPDGKHVYASGFDADALAIFERNPLSGALGFVTALRNGVGGVEGLAGAHWGAISPDGAHVYVPGFKANAIVVFARTSQTGALTFVGAYHDGVNGVGGLAGAEAAAVSSDGANVYVASSGSDAVVVFGRNPASGELTFTEVQQDGKNGVDGLGGAYGVAVEPRGANVYVAGFRDNAVAVFRRDAATGALTFVEVQRYGVGGVTGLRGAHALTVSGDGTRVYAAARNSSAVVEFERNQDTGALTFRTAVIQGHGPATGLILAASVALSPDDTHLYAVGELGNAVALFGTRGAPRCVGDCDRTGNVTVDEIITLVNVALGNALASACPHGVPNGAEVDVVLIIQAVNAALGGCGG